MMLLMGSSAWGQTTKKGHVNPEDRPVDMDSPTFVPLIKVSKVMHEGDSIQYIEMNNVYVYPQPVFKNEKQRQAYNRLVYNVKKVLPIAKEVNRIIIETGDYLQTLPDKKTYSQGKLLIKLVYRECNSSGYELINAFLGPVRAGVWQTFAWLYGASLTKKYEPEGIDRLTERVVLQVEAGQL